MEKSSKMSWRHVRDFERDDDEKTNKKTAESFQALSECSCINLYKLIIKLKNIRIYVMRGENEKKKTSQNRSVWKWMKSKHGGWERICLEKYKEWNIFSAHGFFMILLFFRVLLLLWKKTREKRKRIFSSSTNSISLTLIHLSLNSLLTVCWECTKSNPKQSILWAQKKKSYKNMIHWSCECKENLRKKRI